MVTTLHLAGLCFGEGNGTPLQYSCLENPMDGGAWKAAVHGVTEGWTLKGSQTSFGVWREDTGLLSRECMK